MTVITALTAGPTLIVMPWHDPGVEAHGYDPRGRYAELFVLPVLGPTATWLLRRLVDGLDSYPDGYELDLRETAAALGLSLTPDKSGPFTRAVHRCVMFGYARPDPYGVQVRRMVPPLQPRQLGRLPEHLRHLHQEYVGRPSSLELTRAERTAHALLQAGHAPDGVERVLVSLGHRPGVAARAGRALVVS